jgi:hypothetical protein
MEQQTFEVEALKKIVDVAVRIPRFTYEMQENAPRPKGNYAAIKYLKSENPGFDEIDVTDNEDGTQTMKTVGIRIITAQIMFMRDGEEYINFDNAFYREDVKAVLRELGMAALDKETLNLATLQYETNWEVRKAVKMRFSIIRTQESTIHRMDGATILGEFYDGKNSIKTRG